MTRPFKILGVQQIAIGGPSKEKLRTLWVDMLGLEITGNFVSERENVDEDITAMGKGPFKVEVDLMQPLDPEKKLAEFGVSVNPECRGKGYGFALLERIVGHEIQRVIADKGYRGHGAPAPYDMRV